MSLLKVTLRNSGNINGIRLEKGMSVEVVTKPNTAQVFSTLQGQELVRDAFLRKYNIDLKKANRLSNQYFDVVILNK
jgi:hypothetical protein